ncbi:hypothetical protein [Zhongshania sp.]|uniref:hypothetical protein n=1 Tax=Zhongshania sp. TaxID=1971902 RepID=UPI0039E3CD7F
MKISLLAPQGHGGVRDFSDLLAEKCNAQVSVVVIAWSKSNCDEVLASILESDCVFLQYSGYGYSRRGAPLWLLNQLRLNRHLIRRLGIFFHELYAFGSPLSSAFWLSPAQRYIAKELSQLSDFWITNCEVSGWWLCQYSQGKPHAVMPVFSNLGEAAALPAVRKPNIVILGSAPLREKTYKAAGNKLFEWAGRQGLQIHDVGSDVNNEGITSRLKREGVVVHGRLSKIDVSRLLKTAQFGVVCYLASQVAKSGVFAAYCAHGVCPVLITEKTSYSDKLDSHFHYLPTIPSENIALEKSINLGLNAYNWYQLHNISAHSDVFLEFVK